ncbi:hypothetical protein [Jiangella mangrovi]|uniref:Uncharacterized protein n=1 Tax=Jiangella mangrovi TaxID=1524084 RepID=A0A7W9GMT2_9ACTN|nr:hypothetical protein [Jiangella mangrovi]MBB5786740.1 hypothetical protein [Jiangella mangrovi]
MSPKHGDIKIEDGLTWTYQDPPGTWIIQTPDGPLLRPVEDDFPGAGA